MGKTGSQIGHMVEIPKKIPFGQGGGDWNDGLEKVSTRKVDQKQAKYWVRLKHLGPETSKALGEIKGMKLKNWVESLCPIRGNKGILKSFFF